MNNEPDWNTVGCEDWKKRIWCVAADVKIWNVACHVAS